MAGVAHRLSEAARAHPDRAVFVDDQRQIDWKTLDRISGYQAQQLLEGGLRPGERVAVDLEDPIDMSIGVVAGLKAGGAVTPVNPRLTQDEKEIILGVLKPSAVLTAIEPGEADFDPVQVGLDHPAIILFTSGSTGLPKGVVLSQKATLAGLDSWIEVSLCLKPEDVVLSVLPLAHSYGLFGTILSPLLVGAQTVFVPRFSPSAVAAAIERHNVTIFPGVATMFQRILDSKDVSASQFRNLRCCLSGAAPCSWDLAEAWQTATGVRIVRGYGMSELFRPVCFSPADERDFPESIGRAAKNVSLMTVDLDENPLPDGETGELWIKCPSCMTEYVDRPEETAEVISDGWFKTGDLAYLTEDGFVCIVGRKKEVIIRGGYTIAAGEIELALAAHEDVAEAAVLPVPDNELGEEICACVVLRAGAESGTDAEALVEHCKAHLSSYKYPRIIHILGDLPRTATGKVDKPALVRQIT